MSEVLTEITKMDPTFDQLQFLKDCERDIIPNVLEAQIRGDFKVLEDWCHEAVFITIAHPIKEAKKRGQIIEQKILDIGQIDVSLLNNSIHIYMIHLLFIYKLVCETLHCFLLVFGGENDGSRPSFVNFFHSTTNNGC